MKDIYAKDIFSKDQKPGTFQYEFRPKVRSRVPIFMSVGHDIITLTLSHISLSRSIAILEGRAALNKYRIE